MKKAKWMLAAFMAVMMAFSMAACSDDDPVTPPDPDPTPEPAPDPATTYHFDVVVTVGRQGGMNRDVTTIVKSLPTLTADNGPLNFQNNGVEINADWTMESVYRGKYYYQVPVSADRFSKFRIADDAVSIVQEQPFVTNTYKERSYAHAWLGDNTLLIISTNGEHNKVIWTKLNAETMEILAEGGLDGIGIEPGYDALSTSGIAAYRRSDNKLFYLYFNKRGSGMRAESEPFFRVAVINPDNMQVEETYINTQAGEMAGSAYGELLQNTVMFDESGNLYLAAFTDMGDMEQGHLLRIPAGGTRFDETYDGYPGADGKLLTTQYLGNGKALIYARHDAAGTGIDSYSHYYAILDLATGSRERLQYNGSEVPYSSGRFSQRTAVLDGKAYIGVNTESSNPCVYIYDIATGAVEKGMDIAEGYYFEQIRVMED